VFKALHETIPGASGGIMPIVPEDLVWRFTSRLEFGELNDKVAEDAIRMAQRMSKDWMVMGRRPSGVVGACIILAARMNNFRRTVTEVVYVVKVTVQTIQKRLEEFKQTESSTMTVENFLTNEFLESAHDPPSFYRKDPAWQAKQKKRKRRDMGNYGYKSDDDESDDGVENPNKRSKTSESNAPQPAELRKDAQGFTIPPLPTPAPSQTPAPASSATASPLLTSDIPIDPDLMDARIEKEVGSTFRQLVAEFGDQLATPEVEDEEVEEDADPATDVPKKRGRKKAQEVHVNPEWENADLEMEDRISDLISDPHTMQHAANYAMAQQRVAAHMLIAEHQNPQKEVSMDTHIGVDEFADDPEVQNCLLSPEDVKRKEKVWVNENKAWLRQQQAKLWAAKQAENRPPKAKRNRKPKAQMGTGQKSPANTPAEAAVAVLKERALSKKINYGSIEDVFAGIGFLRNKGMGSAATSRASSEFGDSETASRAESEAPSLEDSDQSFLIQPKSRSRRSATATPQTKSTTPGQPATTTEIDDEDDEEGDEDDYVDQDTPEPTAEQQARRVIPTEDEPEDDWKDGFGDQMEEEDYDDAGMGDLDDDEGAFDNRGFDDEETGYGINDDDY
jgi:transcription factor IIIB subunit 2